MCAVTWLFNSESALICLDRGGDWIFFTSNQRFKKKKKKTILTSYTNKSKPDSCKSGQTWFLRSSHYSRKHLRVSILLCQNLEISFLLCKKLSWKCHQWTVSQLQWVIFFLSIDKICPGLLQPPTPPLICGPCVYPAVPERQRDSVTTDLPVKWSRDSVSHQQPVYCWLGQLHGMLLHLPPHSPPTHGLSFGIVRIAQCSRHVRVFSERKIFPWTRSGDVRFGPQSDASGSARVETGRAAGEPSASWPRGGDGKRRRRTWPGPLELGQKLSRIINRSGGMRTSQ